MKFWQFSTQTLATLLAATVSLTQAGGQADGEAFADPNSAVVQLSTSEYKTFMDSNPLVLAEFFAPWCGYCKMLGPEYSKAADILNGSNPDIKLAQIDCTVEEKLCAEYGIRGYPTLKVFRGEHAEDYQGPRDADGIANYMIQQSLPAVQQAVDVDSLEELLSEQKKVFVVQINPTVEGNDTYNQLALEKRNNFAFISVDDKDAVTALNTKFENVDLSGSKPIYLVVHPDAYDDVREFDSEFTKDNLSDFILNQSIPYFGDINRNTYMSYMNSPLPLGYYFYNTKEERDAIEESLAKLGKQYKSDINFVGLDASLFGKHAEILNMDPEIVPFFAIHDSKENKKYGVSQVENPEGPSIEKIEQLVKDFLDGKAEAIVKSEPLPTEEEKKAQSVVKLVAHNYEEIVGDLSKDIFVKYYAPWCGHCKTLAPIWSELAEIFESNTSGANVIISHIDHTNNDVNTPMNIEGYPTLVFYPANGKVDEETGFREFVVFNSARDLDSLINFIKKEGYHKIDGHELKAKREANEEVENEDIAVEEEDSVHDEL